MSRPAFLVIGEALVDVVKQDTRTIRHPGGSPTNVAVGLARLGHPTTELCYLGDDENGDLLRAHLREAGVREHPAALTASASSVAEIRLDAAGDATYDFSVAWDVPPTIDWTGIEAVHAGSIALVLEPGATHVLELLDSRPKGIRVTIDPNVRQSFLPAADPAAHLERFFSFADLVKLSDEDAAVLYPGAAPETVLARLLELGPTIAAITLGVGGALLATRDATVAVPAHSSTVVDTVGAGDSFMAALVSVVAESGAWDPDAARLRQFGRWAAAAAGITVSRAGANLPTRDELEAVSG
ncbi:MAG: PfkB domain protein [Microbacteriaceae bacterium]|nr:PfkB domain protein [Microbacteriaceae bacterium]